MGLCKCRTVTNLFCFEHKKNVCEQCILPDHEKVSISRMEIPICSLRTIINMKSWHRLVYRKVLSSMVAR